MKDYRLTKRLEVLHPPRYAASWTAEWIDSVTRARMEGFGAEIHPVASLLLTLRIESEADLSTRDICATRPRSVLRRVRQQLWH